MATPEDRIRAALEARFGSLDAAPPDAGELVVSEAVGNLVVGLTRTLGLPGDAVNAALEWFGIEAQPFAGSRGFQGASADAGLAPQPGFESDTFGGRFAENVGTAAVPIAGVMGAGRALAGVSAASVRLPGPLEVAQTAARRPIATLAAETAGAAGAAGGGLIAERAAPDSLSARAVGELLGGLGAGAPVNLATIGGAGATSSLARRATPFTEAGARLRASRRLRSLSDDPERDAGAVAEGGFGESPARRAGNARLIALERLASEGDPAREFRIGRLNEAATQAARRSALAGDPGGAEHFIRILADEAGSQAQRALDALPDNATTRDASIQTRTIIESVDARAKAVEDSLYRRVDDTLAVSPSRLREVYRAELDNMNVADDAKDLPNWVRGLVGNYKEVKAKGQPTERVFVPGTIRPAQVDPATGVEKSPSTETVGVLRRLRSRLLAQESNERTRLHRGKGSANRVRIFNRLADAVLSDLEAIDDGALAAANSFARRRRNRFRRGAVGELRGYEATREASIRPTETLETAFRGGGGETGGEIVRELLRASPRLRPRIETFLLNQFRTAAVDDRTGRINVAALRRFVARNKSTLEVLPMLGTKLENAASAQRAVDELVGAPVPNSVSPLRREKAALALWLDAPTGDELSNVLKQSKNPRRTAAELVRAVNRDPTGRARRGLRTTYVETLLREAENGDPGKVGARLRKLVDDNRAASEVILNPNERQRLDAMVGFFERADVSRGRLPDVGSGLVQDVPGQIADLLARWVGAQSGGRMGQGAAGTPLVMAGFMSRIARRTLGELTNDKARDLVSAAIEDPVLFRSLLIGEGTPIAQRRAAERALNAFLIPSVSSALNRSEQGESSEDRMVRILNEIARQLPGGADTRR